MRASISDGELNLSHAAATAKGGRLIKSAARRLITKRAWVYGRKTRVPERAAAAAAALREMRG